MSYWVGYRVSSNASLLYVESFKSYEDASRHYSRLRQNILPGEILIPPFLARTEEKAREEARKLITN